MQALARLIGDGEYWPMTLSAQRSVSDQLDDLRDRTRLAGSTARLEPCPLVDLPLPLPRIWSSAKMNERSISTCSASRLGLGFDGSVSGVYQRHITTNCPAKIDRPARRVHNSYPARPSVSVSTVANALTNQIAADQSASHPRVDGCWF